MQTLPHDQRAALPIDPAADYIGVKRSTIYKFVREGRVRDIKILGRRVVLREDLDRILRESEKPLGGVK